MPPKPDAREYTAKDVPWRLRDQLQLRAVLAPITGRYHSRDEIPARALAVRKRWWGMLNRLRRVHRWEVLRDKKRFRSIRACPMTFLMVYGKPRSCKLTACPFCWARQAAEWWDQVDAAFFKDATASTPVRGGRAGRVIELDDAPAKGIPRKVQAHRYKLVTRTRRVAFYPFVFRDMPAGRVGVDQLREFYLARLTGSPFRGHDCAWLARVPEIKAGMAAIAREGYRHGCFENVTADMDPTKTLWWAYIRQVWLVPEGRDLPPSHSPAGVFHKQSVIEAPWRTDVMKAMAQACRYPRAMLVKHKDGAPAYQLVTARDGLRLTERYGAFRNRRLRELGGR